MVIILLFLKIHKASKFKVVGSVTNTKYKKIFIKGYTKKWSKEIFLIDSVLKTNAWTYKIKDLKGEKIIVSFFENNCC